MGGQYHQQQIVQAYQVQQGQGSAYQKGQGQQDGDNAMHTIIEVDRDDQKGQFAYQSVLSGVEGGNGKEANTDVKEEMAYSQQQEQGHEQQQHVYRDSVKRRGTMDNDEVVENENSRGTHLYKQPANATAVATSNADELNGDSKQYVE